MAIKEHDNGVSYVRTEKDLPPVAIIDHSPITIRHKIAFGEIGRASCRERVC